MKTRKIRTDRVGRQAFTLIELMVVVAIVAILIGAVFQLVSTVGQYNRKAETIARMQRIQNAISGFYAEYGYYPPVQRYSTPDPWATGLKNDFDKPVVYQGTEASFGDVCTFAAGSQPVSFEFPPPRGMDIFINRSFQKYGVQSPNSLFGSSAGTISEDDWAKVKFFKFGLLSFLLPRVEQIGFAGKNSGETDEEPANTFYDSQQWKKNNPVSNVSKTRDRLAAQQVIENRAVARWLPNLEGIVAGGRTLLGIDTHQRYSGGEGYSFCMQAVKDAKGAITDWNTYNYNNQKYVLQQVTLRDDWGQELFYYSSPPYQSYRLWSAGPDLKTFPPWIPLNATKTADERKWAASITADDIVRFDK